MNLHEIYQQLETFHQLMETSEYPPTHHIEVFEKGLDNLKEYIGSDLFARHDY